MYYVSILILQELFTAIKVYNILRKIGINITNQNKHEIYFKII